MNPQFCYENDMSNSDAMMHVLNDSINLKYSELLTKVISKCNLIGKLIILEETSFNISCNKLLGFILLLSHR